MSAIVECWLAETYLLILLSPISIIGRWYFHYWFPWVIELGWITIVDYSEKYWAIWGFQSTLEWRKTMWRPKKNIQKSDWSHISHIFHPAVRSWYSHVIRPGPQFGPHGKSQPRLAAGWPAAGCERHPPVARSLIWDVDLMLHPMFIAKIC